MADLDPSIDFDAHLARESDRFLEAVLAAGVGARVPGCPGWDSDDLLWHLVHTQQFWADVLRTRPAPPADPEAEPERPVDRVGLVCAFERATTDLRAQLAAADDHEPAWTWHATLHTAGFIRRRQAHEALIHRVDAEQAAAAPTAIDAALATDGVLECLSWMYAGQPDWGAFTPDGRTVAIETTDTGGRVLVDLGRFRGLDPKSKKDYDEPDLDVSARSDGSADATIRGAAADLDQWIWHRRSAEGISREGDSAALATLDEILAQPIN